MQSIDPAKLPRHVGIIMDGNGRWAKQRFRNRIFGHEEGANSVREVARCCRKLEIPYLTLYAFSKENWQRPKSEVSALWSLLDRFLESELPEMVDKEIRLRHLGDPEGIPEDVLARLRKAIDETSGFDKLTLSLAINYGGRQEILLAARKFAQDVQEGRHLPEDLTDEVFSSYLFTADYPDPDLIIRTGGEYRVSNFLLWQLAYAELYTSQLLWPDFREEQFMEALVDYQGRERRFGKTGDQLKSDSTD
ncbi:isoprenyl transferase [Desulforhabdus sp. TSK]|uniref:isoprenyl transferase n=1 Tax=Desulforhabdus sp. TSK TaxID=2925014 RepID=UPI001FC89046|nr:isoprenyl transferase [Desulforhabdus sp. TSK]GKT09491.1 isoprenyl transferase [Desulforhabdus sp. TSK]